MRVRVIYRLVGPCGFTVECDEDAERRVQKVTSSFRPTIGAGSLSRLVVSTHPLAASQPLHTCYEFRFRSPQRTKRLNRRNSSLVFNRISPLHVSKKFTSQHYHQNDCGAKAGAAGGGLCGCRTCPTSLDARTDPKHVAICQSLSIHTSVRQGSEVG